MQQNGSVLGMPMALISPGSGQPGCFPTAYLMAPQDSLQQQAQQAQQVQNPQAGQQPQHQQLPTVHQ